MFRNKDCRTLVIIQLCIILIGGVTALLINVKAGIVFIVCNISLMIIVYLFLWKRYKNINQLSMYLYQIINNGYSLDIRDNKEGELSILKNEIYKVTVKLAEQAERLKKDKVYLSDVMSDISHQLKTPLTSMFVMIDLLKDKGLPDEKRNECINKINSQLKRIEWLVSSLLKLSKLDAGTVILKKQPINVKQLIDKSLEHLIIPMEIKQQELVLGGDEDTNIIGDFNWLVEAFANIIKNCVEHTGIGGTIKITCKTFSIYTQITISDNGEGIDEVDIVHIFERFYKGKNATPDSIGIGLAMAKNIILNQSGTIEVNSTKDKGTEFIIRIYKGIV